MDQRAAQAKLLLHAARQLARRSGKERIEAGRAGERIDPPSPLRPVMAEQAAEKLQILLDRQGGIEILAQPLRHIGDARAHIAAMALVAHVAAQHMDIAILDDMGAGDEGEQAGLAHAIGSDQADHPPARYVEIDAAQRLRLAIMEADAGQADDRIDRRRADGVGLVHWTARDPSGRARTASEAGQATPGSIRT